MPACQTIPSVEVREVGCWVLGSVVCFQTRVVCSQRAADDLFHRACMQIYAWPKARHLVVIFVSAL